MASGEGEEFVVWGWEEGGEVIGSPAPWSAVLAGDL